MPETYEGSLLTLQYENTASIFGCEEYAVYSNLTVEIAPGIWTTIVNFSFSCTKGENFLMALNIEVFCAVWAKVLNDGRFRFHDWTVKVDPDTVFFPARLRKILRNHFDEGGDANKGIYLNNCKGGLQGPIEVFSRNAVQRWGTGVV